MKAYHDLLNEVLHTGELIPTRAKLLSTGNQVSAYTLFGRQIRFSLQDGFPLITTKKISFHSIKIELLWFLKGSTNVAYLQENNVTIWNEWAREGGELGPVYGKQWRSWQSYDGSTIDQIKIVIDELKKNPNSRRMIVSAWNVADLKDMALPPCHLLFQFYVSKNQQLSCMLTLRSSDVFLGLPYNIASYALLTCMFAQVLGYTPGELIISLGNVHLYENHVEQAKIQLARKPLPQPVLSLQPQSDVFSYLPEHIQICWYQYHPSLPAEVAV